MLAATADCEGAVKQKGCGVISRIYGAEGLRRGGKKGKPHRDRSCSQRSRSETSHVRKNCNTRSQRSVLHSPVHERCRIYINNQQAETLKASKDVKKRSFPGYELNIRGDYLHKNIKMTISLLVWTKTKKLNYLCSFYSVLQLPKCLLASLWLLSVI